MNSGVLMRKLAIVGCLLLLLCVGHYPAQASDEEKKVIFVVA
jgi:hypothetical protein